MKCRNPLVVITTLLLALVLILGASSVHAAVKVRAAINGDIIVDISDNRGIASYWIFARNIRGPILAMNVGVKAWWFFRCPKRTQVTLKLPPQLIGQAIFVKYLPCGTTVPEDYVASSITTDPADAVPVVYKGGSQVDEDGTSFRVIDYEGGFVILQDHGDGTLSLEKNFPLPPAMDFEPIDPKLFENEPLELQ